MTRGQYEAISAPFRDEKRRKILLGANRAVTWLCYAAYPVLLIALALLRDQRFFWALGVPAVSFGALSLVRSKLNFPRPYQVLDIVPLIHKETRGKSMPSRHVFSIFVIAMTFLWVLPWAGVVMLALGALLGLVRVVGGVHFPRDVLVGAACGVCCGLVGYWGLAPLF